VVIDGKHHVASECGGDWWGHFRTNDGLHIILIADATGHGAPAALVTALAYSCCTTLAETFRDPAVHQRSVRGILASLHRVLWIAGQGQTTMTALAMILDPLSGDLTFASAGHNMPYHAAMKREQGAASRPPAAGPVWDVSVMQCKGMPLGFFETFECTERTVRLSPGDVILLYTDGLIDCRNPAGARLSKRQLQRTFSKLASQGAAQVVNGVVKVAFDHFAGKPIDDDVTVVAIELRARQNVAA
jgi:sigma-B regulation protein RsbU (phosphoserine phosphatase)